MLPAGSPPPDQAARGPASFFILELSQKGPKKGCLPVRRPVGAKGRILSPGRQGAGPKGRGHLVFFFFWTRARWGAGAAARPDAPGRGTQSRGTPPPPKQRVPQTPKPTPKLFLGRGPSSSAPALIRRGFERFSACARPLDQPLSTHPNPATGLSTQWRRLAQIRPGWGQGWARLWYSTVRPVMRTGGYHHHQNGELAGGLSGSRGGLAARSEPRLGGAHGANSV